MPTCDVLAYITWLVVWNIFYFSIGNNQPNWLSYFSEGLKPPTSYMLVWLRVPCMVLRLQHSCAVPCAFRHTEFSCQIAPWHGAVSSAVSIWETRKSHWRIGKMVTNLSNNTCHTYNIQETKLKHYPFVRAFPVAISEVDWQPQPTRNPWICESARLI